MTVYSISGTHDYLKAVDVVDMRYMEHFCSPPPPFASYEFLELCEHTMSIYGLSMPSNVMEALDLYLELTYIIDEIC